MDTKLSIFLEDPESIPRGRMSFKGEPLNRLEFPYIETLIVPVKTDSVPRMPKVSSAPVLLNEPSAVGIHLGLDLYEPTVVSTEGYTVGTKIPSTYKEIRDNLNLISTQRSGTRSSSYSLSELKQIAKSINISVTGKKEMIAARIREEVLRYYGESIDR